MTDTIASAPILTDAQVAAIPATATTAAPRAVPYKRWVLAGALAFAIIAGGALSKSFHKHAPATLRLPIPIAQSIPPLALPAPPEKVEVVCPLPPLAAPLPTIPPKAIEPTPFSDDRYVAPPKKTKKHR